MTEPLHRLARIAWVAYEYVAMVLGLGCLAVLCLAWLPFAAVLYALLPRRLGQPVGRLLIMGGFRVYLRFLSIFCAFRFDLTELDMLPRGQPVVLVANHPSLLDAVMIISRFPDMVCVMKATLMANPLLGSAARLARYIPNNAPLDMILRGRKALREGAHLLIFPEGTRTAHFPVDTCTASAGLIAQRAEVPVQSVLIECNSPSPYLGKTWPLWRPPELPLRFRIRLGRRFAPPRNVVAFAGELEAHFRAELAGPPAQPETADLASAQEALS
jgi:1-acyl-sn-glycerol-3-phosphate acyltransferase